ncbi:MAG: hypothetical protein FJY73_03610 [Candidatus Eisenbacteria bacterium]|nr:hypothetical protein [Candidatus Eisenbacteria bacterium]
MSRPEVLAAAGAVVLLALQIAVGGSGPFGRSEWGEEIARREAEVRALEEARARERAESRLLEEYLASAGSALAPRGVLPEEGVPGAWREAFGRFAPGRAEWSGGEPIRLRVRGRFADAAHLLGVIDRTPGPLRIDRLEIVPEGGGVALTVQFSSVAEGGA